MREIDELPPAVPAVETPEAVHAEYEDNGFIGKFLAVELQRFHRASRSVAPELPRVHVQAGLVVDGRMQQLEATRRIGEGCAAKTRIGGGQQAHAVEREHVAHFQCEP